MSINPAWKLLLWAPERIDRRLDALVARGTLEARPSLWQVWMGVLYMWSRVLTRPDTIGITDAAPVRATPRARRLEHRLWRLPAVLAARAVNPLDQVGLGSSPEHIIRHLISTYHPGENALYDLQVLDVDEGAIEALHAAVRAVLDGTDPRAELRRDLCVYEGYHERLLALVERWRREGPQGFSHAHPDTTVRAFMGWCARQPDGPAATWEAWKAGRLRLGPEG